MLSKVTLSEKLYFFLNVSNSLQRWPHLNVTKNQSVLGLEGEGGIHLCVPISFILLIREESLRNHLSFSRRHETRIQVFFSPSVFVVQNVWLSYASLGMHIEFSTLFG